MMDLPRGNKLGRKERGLTTQIKKLANLLKVLSFGLGKGKSLVKLLMVRLVHLVSS